MVLSLGGPDNLFQRLELSTMCLLTQWCSAAAGALTLIKPSHQHFYQSDLFPTKSRKCFTYHGLTHCVKSLLLVLKIQLQENTFQVNFDEKLENYFKTKRKFNNSNFFKFNSWTKVGILAQCGHGHWCRFAMVFTTQCFPHRPSLIGFHENGRKTNFEFRRALLDNEEKENAIAKIIRS